MFIYLLFMCVEYYIYIGNIHLSYMAKYPHNVLWAGNRNISIQQKFCDMQLLDTV